MKVGLLQNQKPIAPSEVNFRGKTNLNALAEEVSKKSKWLPRMLTYLGQHDGEILNTTVTAVGTAAVAPVFIIANPMSNEDAETRWYTAMRQPISAVIAFLTQLFVNKQFNNFMDKAGSTGLFGERYSLKAMPKADYLRRIIKLENPEFTDQEIAAEVSKRQMLAERKVIAEVREQMQGKTIKTSELISKDIFDEAKKQLIEEFKIAHKDELIAQNVSDYNEFLDKTLSREKITKRAIENVEKSIELETQAKFRVRELANKFNNIDDAIRHVSEMVAESPKEEEILKSVLNRLETVKIYEESKGMKPFVSVKNLGKTYEEVLHNVKVKRLVRARTSDAAKSLSSANKWLGIIVSLVTLPFSCGALNWAYPRVMEKIMPPITKWIHRNDAKIEATEKKLDIVVTDNTKAVEEAKESGNDGGDDDED